MVAIKRLDSALGQGAPEFWKEIMMLSRYKHENLVSLLGFCDESGENILVYEYLSNKSLDLYLSSTDLSWNQRLRICIGAACGLQYLHDPDGTQHRVLHRDIKSANILLDQNWKAKISDFGLSKFGPANQQFTFLVSAAVGTIGYCDPLYMQTGFLTKESDVYSFGVVLFEVLCGRLCVQNYEDIRRFLARLAQQCYEEKKLDTIIDSSLKEQISLECLERFSTIAYQCLRIDRTKRPAVAKIVKELEIALQYQVEYEFEKEKELKRHVVLESDSDEYWETKLPRDSEVIIRMFNIPRTIYTIKKELFSHLQKGLLFDEGNKFFWINDYGKKCVLLSARRFLNYDQARYPTWVFQRDLRFSRVAEYSYRKCYDIKCEIRMSMLSLGIMYAASLVFKYRKKPNEDLEHLKLVTIKWKIEELSVYSTHNAELTPDNWYNIKMWHFVNHWPNANFNIVLEELSYFSDPVKSDLLIQGIEFQPIEMHEEIEGFKNLSISDEEDIDEDVYWEKKLPNDYQHYIQMSDKPLHYTNKKELYFLLCAGFLAYGGELWFSLCKSTGGICFMLPATDILRRDFDYEPFDTLSLSESRFSEVKKLKKDAWYIFRCRLRSTMFSPQNIYACYLVFKFADNHIQPIATRLFKAMYTLVGNGIHQGTIFAHLNLPPPMNIPTMKPKNDYGSLDSSNIPRIEGLRMPKGHMEHLVDSWMEQRKDGWMEVMLCKSLPQLEDHKSLEVTLKSIDGDCSDIIVEGMEFRPMQGCF